LAHLQHGLGIAGISYGCQPAKPGENLTQKFETLAGKIGRLHRQSSDVAAWSRQTCDQAAADRVCPRWKDDGDDFCRLHNVGRAKLFVTMTSTLRRTNSSAISTLRSGRPSDQRYSIAMVRPSIQPSSR